MTYFEALQRPADLVAVLPHWPIACICTHDLALTYRNQNQSFPFTIFKPTSCSIPHKRYHFFFSCSAATHSLAISLLNIAIILLCWSCVRIVLFFCFIFICIIWVHSNSMSFQKHYFKKRHTFIKKYKASVWSMWPKIGQHYHYTIQLAIYHSAKRAYWYNTDSVTWSDVSQISIFNFEISH